MAKELPYWKFEPNQWENGNIQMCSREDKGLFIELCSLYWSRLGSVPFKLAVRKLCDGNATAFDSLLEEDIFSVNDGFVCIDFLNEQLQEFEDISEQNRANARKRWTKKRAEAENMRPQSDRKATVDFLHSESDAIREEKRREEKKREEKKREEERLLVFESFWNIYDKKTGKPKCESKFLKLKDSEIEEIMKVIPEYVESTPDKQYRKNPLTWLNGRHWEDEIKTTSNKPLTIGEKIKLMRNGEL